MSAIKRNVRPKRRRTGPPRRGSFNDPARLEWLATQPCIASWADPYGCSGRITIHHVRRYGEQKRDDRALPACEGHHLYESGEFSIERIGKQAFERRNHLNLERLIVEHNERYQQERGKC